MKILSWNVRGLGGPERRLLIKEMVKKNKAQVAMLQESKISSMTEEIIKEVWGRRHVKWICIDADGVAGGILILWDGRLITVSQSWRDQFSATVVEDMEDNQKWILTSVYGPVDHHRRRDFWRELDKVRGRWNGAWCIGGDWNAFP